MNDGDAIRPRSRTLGRCGAALLAGMVFGGCTADAGRARFARDVAPVLARRCGAASCHGEPPGAHSTREYHFPTNAIGGIDSPDRVEAAYVASRRFIHTSEYAELSSLLRKPLPPETSGVSHGGGTTFRDRDDPAYVAVRDWIRSERGGGEDRDPATLTPRQVFFRDNVQPALRAAQCMLGPCHGAASAIPLRFDPGVDGHMSVGGTVHNYGEAVLHLNLAGWPERSRLIRKALTDPADAMPHRGGNGIAGFPTSMADPLPQSVIAWARLERAARANATDEHRAASLVFVAGPPRPGRVTEIDGFFPGTDLYEVRPAEPGSPPTNLTSALHTQPVEIRNPCVSDDGTRLAFSLRRGPTDGATIWEMNLGDRSARAVTQSVRLPNGQPSTDVWPAYAPDGRIWFASNRAGVLMEHGDGYDTDLYVIEADGSATRRTHTPSPELATTFFRYGRETTGQVGFTAIRRLGEDYQGVVYRFPNDLHIEYHIQYGANLADDMTFHMRETADGNYTAVMLDRDAVWQAGALFVTDRNMGPEVHGTNTPSLPGFIHPASYLGPYGSHDDRRPMRRETSDGAYRDPAPLPDGRIAVAYAEGRVELRNRAVTPDFGLYAVTLAFDPVTRQFSVQSRDRVVDLPGVSETEPVAVFRNAPGTSWGAPPRGATGRVTFSGVQILQQVIGAIGPTGERPMRDDIRYVRVLRWVPQAADPTVTNPSASLFREQRQSGATPHMPATALAEIPVESDGTFFVEMDAQTSWRLQYLDSRRMVVGTQHNRWFDLNGGQFMRQGAQPSTFDFACTHCHGARSGRAVDTFQPVDITTRPSRSLARYENDDPDRPRAPVRVASMTTLATDWRSDVAPMLQRSCATAGCHDAVARAGALVLEPTRTRHYDAAYEALVALGSGSANGFRYVDVTGTRARGSWLVERVLGVELDAPGAVAMPGAHRGQPALTDEQVATLTRWIESGALYCATGCP